MAADPDPRTDAGPTDTDDTTEADAGLPGGSGATAEGASAQPLATESPQPPDADPDDSREQDSPT